MNALIRSDFIIAKSYLVQQMIIGILAALFVCFASDNIYVVAPIVVCTGAFSQIFTLISLDESNGWERYRLSLPLSRSEIMKGRYCSAMLFILMFSAAGIAVALILFPVIQALEGIVPFGEYLIAQAHEFSLQSFVASLILPICILLVMNAVVLPFCARFGMTKAIRFFPLAIMGIIIIGFVALAPVIEQLDVAFLSNLLEWLNTAAGFTIAMAAMTAIGVALFAASSFIAAKLYTTREF